MEKLAQQVKKVAIENGAALVGFAPVSRFENAPPEFHPHTIFPQTKTVIAITLPHARGTLKAVEEGTYWQSYNCDSYWYLNEILSPYILRVIIMFLEEHGYTSVPIHNPFHPHSGKKTREDQPAGPDGMISLRVIGVAAGLGELGVSKLLLTPQYGPRQRVFAVFTDAELEPTPLFKGKICDDCMLCVKECQANAIGKSRDITITIEDQEYSHAPLDCESCGHIHRGEDPKYSPFWNGTEKQGETPSYNQFVSHRFNHLAICVARGCLRSCLDHLEKTGRIEKTFKTPFIERKRWVL